MKRKIYTSRIFSNISAAIVFLLLNLIFASCTEEIDFKTETFESALVVQANLTNETTLKKIVLSRTFAFEDDGPPPESNANVSVTDDLNTIYQFQESAISGTYFSITAFSATIGRQYTLNITTSDGRTYQSAAVTLKGGTEIGRIYAERTINAQNVDGVSIFLDSYDAANNSKYYRFEYEETYKIVSRYTSDKNFSIGANNQVVLVPKTEEETVCYNTAVSNNIALATTSSFGEDRLSRFPIRFLELENPKIGNRYSILVRQYVISREAYTFYETLRNFSGSESLFSQVQPGFITGNIQSTQNSNEKVIGFFEVATVSEKRIFFNYRNLVMDDIPPTPFGGSCEAYRPPISALYSLVVSNAIKYFYTAGADDPPELGEGPYYVLDSGCIDCRVFGSNIVPDFWEE